MIVANNIQEKGSGFGADTNRVIFLSPDAPPEELPLLSKKEVAERLFDHIVKSSF